MRTRSRITYAGVYRITSRVTKECYVGKTFDLLGRFRQHMKTLAQRTHSSPAMQRLYDLHGEDQFEFSVLEHSATDSLDKEREPGLNLLLCQRERVWAKALQATLMVQRLNPATMKWVHEGRAKARWGGRQPD